MPNAKAGKKIALKPTDAPAQEALNRIASAVEKQNRHPDERLSFPIPVHANHEKKLKSNQENALEEKAADGKFYEIPSLLDGFRIVNQRFFDRIS